MREPGLRDNIIGIISQFCAAVSNARLYACDHPLIAQYAEKTHTELDSLLDAANPLTIFIIGDDLVVGDIPLQSAGPLVEKFSRILKEKGVERISFYKGLSFPEFFGFITDLASSGLGSIQSRPNMKLGKVEIRAKGTGEPSPPVPLVEESSEILESLIHLRDSEMNKIKEFYSLVKRSDTADAQCVDYAVRGFIRGFSKNINPLGVLASVKTSDEYTFTHTINVGILTIAQAEKLGFSGKQLYDIGIASMLHDVGKIYIPEEILDKPGKLTPEEWAIMESHTTRGGMHLLGLRNIPDIAVLGAVEHHIRFNGSGYPFIKNGWKPSIVAQMIAISDMFDALRSRRVYSEPKPLELILNILIKEKGTNFNPVLVDNFIGLVAPEKLLAEKQS